MILLLQRLYSKLYKKEFITTKRSPSSSSSKSRKKQERDRERVISQTTDSPEPNTPQEQTKKVIHVYN